MFKKLAVLLLVSTLLSACATTAYKAKSQFDMGNNYFKGRGVIQDFYKAHEHYQQAAKAGHAQAQYNLGFLYANGLGAEKSLSSAAYWWQKAADQGVAPAQNSLGTLYSSGKGVPKDKERALYWWEKAAKQGDITAQKNLGAYYVTDGKPDLNLAYMWMWQAAMQGDEKAIGFIQIANKGLGTANLAIATKLAKNCETSKLKKCGY